MGICLSPRERRRTNPWRLRHGRHNWISWLTCVHFRTLRRHRYTAFSSCGCKTEESSAPNKICYLTLVMGEWRAPKKEWKREGGKGNNLDARHTRLWTSQVAKEKGAVSSSRSTVISLRFCTGIGLFLPVFACNEDWSTVFEVRFHLNKIHLFSFLNFNVFSCIVVQKQNLKRRCFQFLGCNRSLQRTFPTLRFESKYYLISINS